MFVVKTHQYKVSSGVVLDDYYIVERRDHAVIVASDKGQVLFLEQYRPGTRKVTLNLPMGFVEPGEAATSAALRELSEETGFVAETLEHLGVLDLAPSFMNTRAHVFFASDLQFSTSRGIDHSEGSTRVLRFPARKVREMIRDGRITDLSSCAAILLAVDAGFL